MLQFSVGVDLKTDRKKEIKPLMSQMKAFAFWISHYLVRLSFDYFITVA